MSLSKLVEMRLTLWSAVVMQFLLYLVGTSDFQCVELRSIQILLTPLNLLNMCGKTHHILSLYFEYKTMF